MGSLRPDEGQTLAAWELEKARKHLQSIDYDVDSARDVLKVAEKTQEDTLAAIDYWKKICELEERV